MRLTCDNCCEDLQPSDNYVCGTCYQALQSKIQKLEEFIELQERELRDLHKIVDSL